MAVDCVHRRLGWGLVALSGPGIHLQLCAAQALAASRARGRIAGPRGFLVGHYWSSRGERTDGRCTEKQRAGGCADCRMARQAPPRFCAPCPLQQCSWAWRPRGGPVLADVCFVSRCLSRTRCQTVRQSSKMPTCPVRRPRLEEPGSRLPLPAGQRRVGRVRGHRVPTICGAG